MTTAAPDYSKGSLVADVADAFNELSVGGQSVPFQIWKSRIIRDWPAPACPQDKFCRELAIYDQQTRFLKTLAPVDIGQPSLPHESFSGYAHVHTHHRFVRDGANVAVNVLTDMTKAEWKHRRKKLTKEVDGQIAALDEWTRLGRDLWPDDNTLYE